MGSFAVQFALVSRFCLIRALYSAIQYADADDDFLDSLEEEPDEDETIEEEDFSIDDLIGMCSVVFVAIQNDEVEKQQEEDEAFAQLLSMDGRRIAT